jgi:hypothetical protein
MGRGSLAGINSKWKEEFAQWHSQANREAEKLVNAWNGASLDVGQCGMRNIKVSVAFFFGNISGNPLNIARFDQPLVAQ